MATFHTYMFDYWADLVIHLFLLKNSESGLLLKSSEFVSLELSSQYSSSAPTTQMYAQRIKYLI